jgi:hypothetical protein
MQRSKPFKMRITNNQLIQVAIESIHRNGNLDSFWKYITAGRQCGILTISDLEVKRLLSLSESLIYGRALDRQDEDSKLSSTVQTESPIPNRSGIIDLAGASPDTRTPEATAKSESLVTDIAARYGWTATGKSSMGQYTIYHHWELDIHVYAYGRPVLQVTGPDGIQRPCLQYESYMTDTPYKGDAVASLLLTCITSPEMANHIERFCPGYLARWNKYQSKLLANLKS